MTLMTSDELLAFGANAGSISPITEREATGDRSVTLDKHDKSVLYSRVPAERYARKGGAMPNGNPERHEFFVYPHNAASGVKLRSVPVVHPKKRGNELRLYGSSGTGLDFRAGDYFYILVRDGELRPFIGTISPDRFEKLVASAVSKGASANSAVFDDEEEDAAFQQAIADKAAGLPVSFSGTRYPRSAQVALEALESADFQCECSSKSDIHSTFVAASTGKSYVEAHHLVPLSKQADYEKSLDIVENIVALCPNCHRRLHYGSPECRIECLLVLLEKRRTALLKRGVDIDENGLMSAYGIGIRHLLKHFGLAKTAGDASIKDATAQQQNPR